MKVKDRFNLLKKQYKDYIVFISSGTFIDTFFTDAVLVNYIMSYMINNDKLGFPKSAKDKVIKKLDELEINYIVFDQDEVLEKKFDTNNYYKVFSEAQKYNYEKNSINLLLDRIKVIIESSQDNYIKVRDFIDKF